MTASADTSVRPRPHAGILAADPYVPGKSKAPGVAGPVYKLSSNETPLGASPRAIDAFRTAVDALPAYPDGTATPLREALGIRHGLDPARIVCGAGSDEILYMLANIYCEPGDEGIYTEHGFLLYRVALLAAEAVPVIVPERDFRVDVDAILAAVTAPHQDRLHRQSQQPDRHLRRPRGGAPARRRPAAARAAGARRRLRGIRRRSPTTTTASPSCTSARTWWSPAPSRRSTGWPA